MAKGKRAAALFEVIQASKQKEQLRAGGGFLTPSWWFKGKGQKNGNAAEAPAPKAAPSKPAPKPGTFAAKFAKPAPVPEPIVEEISASAPIDVSPAPEFESAQEEETAITESVERDVETTPAASDATVASQDVADESPSASEHADIVDNSEPALEDPKPAPTAKLRAPGAHRSVDLGLDRGKQQINLKLSFTSAAISSFGLLVVLGLAFLIGKSMGRGPSQAGANSIDDVKKQPVFTDVLKVTPSKNNGTNEQPIAVAPASKAPVAVPAPTGTGTGSAKQTPTAQATQSAPQVTSPKVGLGANGKRIANMQYVLIQSYPDPEDANDAAAALNKAGVAATVEKGTRFAPTWSCVIGTRGFDHTKNNPEYDAYLKSIQDVSNTFAGTSKFRRFEPRAVGWKE